MLFSSLLDVPGCVLRLVCDFGPFCGSILAMVCHRFEDLRHNAIRIDNLGQMGRMQWCRANFESICASVHESRIVTLRPYAYTEFKERKVVTAMTAI